MKILLVSHSPTATTGYGRVTRRIAHALREAGHSLAVVGAGFAGGPHELPYRIFPWPEMSAGAIGQALRTEKPDVLLTIGDPWMFESLPALPEIKGTTWLAYFPVDGRPLPMAWKHWVQAVDVPVVFSKFAQEVVGSATGTPPRLIYHGVDTDVFCPQDKEKAKALASVSGRFVVGTVARNHLRKNLPALIKAFAAFAANKPDALLYLHTQLRGEWDIAELTKHFGIEAKTRVTAEPKGERGVPDAVLATLYNAMDLFVLPTMAEGFGLPIMESQSCGVPALVTDYSACPELLPDLVQRLKVKETLIMNRNFEQAVVDGDDLTTKLEHFYRNREELAALGLRCREFAKQFEWSDACRQVVDLLASLPVRPKTGPISSFSAGAGANAPGPGVWVSGPQLSAAKGIEPAAAPAHSEEAYKRILEADRDDVAALHGLGRLWLRRGDLDGANRVLARAGKLHPEDAVIQKDLAEVLFAKGDFQRASERFRQATMLRPGFALAHQRLAETSRRLGRLDVAVSEYAKIVEMKSDSAAAHNDLGACLGEMGRPEEAVACYREALRLKPDFHQVLVNLAVTLLHGRDLPGAEASCRQAIRIDPSYGPAHNTLGAVLLEGGRVGESRDAFRAAVHAQPQDVEAHVNLGITLLTVGEFREGWGEFEWRRRRKDKLWNRSGRAWDGSDPAGKTILLYGEGGLGNQIHFARYASLLAKAGAKVILECHSSLKPLLASFPGVEKVAAHGESTRPPDFHCPLLSVAGIVGTGIDSIPVREPYLHGSPELIEFWRKELVDLVGCRVGVCWQGDQRVVHMRKRSFPLARLEPLSNVDGIRLISLQKDLPAVANFKVEELAALPTRGWQLTDMAALLCNLDLVVTCDTSIAHLAGALGVKVWVALPFSADWRWLLKRHDSPWYPTMRLFRQQAAGDWKSVFEAMAQELVAGSKDTVQPVTNRREVDPPASKVFGYFDRAYVLNLDTDVERMARACSRLSRLSIPFERFAALTPPDGMISRDRRFTVGHYACALSHRAILQRIWESRDERVLIFEDDVVLRDDTNDWMRRIVPQLTAIPWDVFYLGLHLMDAGECKGENLLRVERGFHAHAYAVSRPSIPRLIAAIDQTVAVMAGTFDGYEDPRLFKVCTDPILAVQEPNFSHTYGRPIDRLDEYFTKFDREEFLANCGEAKAWLTPNSSTKS